MPLPTDQLWILTDGSVKKHSIGALMYADGEEKLFLSGHFSARLHGHQPSCLPCEVEALAIASTIKHFSSYLIQSKHHPAVFTDSRPGIQAYEKLCCGQSSASSRLTLKMMNSCWAIISQSRQAIQKDPNNNPVVEKAVQDIERKLPNVYPIGSLVSSASLTIACCALNSWLGSLRLSPREVLNNLDQFTNERIHFNDKDLIDIADAPAYNERPKAPNRSRRLHTEVEVGDIKYLHGNLKKNKTMAVKGTWCHPNRTIGSTSGSLQAPS